MTVHDPDHHHGATYPPEHHRPESAYNPAFLPEAGTGSGSDPAPTTCCNCLFPYHLTHDCDRCPRCGADPCFAVPRGASEESHYYHDDHHRQAQHHREVDRFGLLILFVGFGLSVGLTAFLGLTSSWATSLTLIFTAEPEITVTTWVRWSGFSLSLLAALRATSSLLSWRSGRYFYRNFQIEHREFDDQA